MYDELTKVDIDKMKEELEYRITVVRPKILEEVKFTRSFGDLSENAEYHAAKRERGKNDFIWLRAVRGAKQSAAKFFRKWELFLQRSRPKEYNAQGGTTT